MSFGLSISDISSLMNLAWRLYEVSKNFDVASEYRDFGKALLACSETLSELQKRADLSQSMLCCLSDGIDKIDRTLTMIHLDR